MPISITSVMADAAKRKRVGSPERRFTVEPPTKTRPHKNILIRLCDYESCMSHPLEECAYPVAAEYAFPKRFDSLVRQWGELSDRVVFVVTLWKYL